MPAPLGNDYNKKLKTKDIKEKVYKDYCDHLAEGKMATSWYYDKDGLELTWNTIERYIKEDEDFDSIKKELAISKGLKVWEKICEDGAKGENSQINVPCLQMVMRNKFGWDKQTTEVHHQPLHVSIVDYSKIKESSKKKEG